MNKEQLPDELFDWLADKTYEELLPSERTIVDQSIGSNEYAALRATVQDFQLADVASSTEQLIPPLSQRPKALWKRIVLYPVPAYQAAAAVLLLVGIGGLIQGRLAESDPPADGVEVFVKGIPIDQDQYPEALVFEL